MFIRHGAVLRRAAKDTVLILARLQAAYPHPEGPAHEALHALLGPTNERVTAQAADLLHAGNAERLGALCWPFLQAGRSPEGT